MDLCEVRYSNGECITDKAKDLNLRNRMRRFEKTTKCRKLVCSVAVTPCGVEKNGYRSVVSGEVTLEDLFEKYRY